MSKRKGPTVRCERQRGAAKLDAAITANLMGGGYGG